MFKEAADSYKIIHIASHSIANERDPMYSKIAFASNPQDTLNDGYLQIFELYNIKLNADMAVLSACDTGYGKVQKGEGVMSLGNGFAYAGVPSIVMSHWQVDDKSTYILMNSFYKYLSEGMNKSEAMRAAKLDLLNGKNSNYANPYYWGAFVTYGDDSSIRPKSISGLWYVAVVLIVLITIVAFLKKSKWSA